MQSASFRTGVKETVTRIEQAASGLALAYGAIGPLASNDQGVVRLQSASR